MRIFLAIIALLTVFAASAFAQDAAYRGPTRVNFDERVIKGQTAKSGSVYIFDRQQVPTSSLVNKKRLFRERTIRTVFEE
jgi:hypothetical protein